MKRRFVWSPNETPTKKLVKTEMATNWNNFHPKSTAQVTSGSSGEGTSKFFDVDPNTSCQSSEGAREHADQSRFNFFGKSVTEKTYFFTGSVERVIKWHRIFKNRCCYFEVIASIVSLQEGPINLQKIILLKDNKGPILQVIHYLNHVVQLEDFSIGQMLRCVGYMSGPNVLTAISIRSATTEEVATLKRYCYIGDFSISGLINAEDNQ